MSEYRPRQSAVTRRAAEYQEAQIALWDASAAYEAERIAVHWRALKRAEARLELARRAHEQAVEWRRRDRGALVAMTVWVEPERRSA